MHLAKFIMTQITGLQVWLIKRQKRVIKKSTILLWLFVCVKFLVTFHMSLRSSIFGVLCLHFIVL